jgi:hypothetical protein
MNSHPLVILSVSATFFLASCGGGESSGGSSTTTSISTTTTPSQQLTTTIKNLCKTNCNTTVPADNPSSRLQATIKTLKPNANASVAKDNPSVRLGKIVSNINFNMLCSSGDIAMTGCPNCGYGTPFNVQGSGTPNLTYDCQCNNGEVFDNAQTSDGYPCRQS